MADKEAVHVSGYAPQTFVGQTGPKIVFEQGAAERTFPGDSELAAVMRTFNWSKTPLGPSVTWPGNLRNAMGLCLTSRIPIVLYWGQDFHVLYNEAFLALLGENHDPRYLGQPGRECWREIWEAVGPMLKSVQATARAMRSEDVPMFFARRLPLEEVYIRFTFGPILTEDARSVDGIFCQCIETTELVVAARRLETLRRLGIRAPKPRRIQAAYGEAIAITAENPKDIPFAALYLLDETGQEANLCASTGLPEGHSLPRRGSMASIAEPAFEPLARVIKTQCMDELTNLMTLGEKTRRAMVLPIAGAVPGRLAGLLVLGVSPHRVLDDDYRTFFELAARHIGTSIADARASEAERKRAEALNELGRVKAALFDSANHEFCTPLTVMLAPLEAAMANLADESRPTVLPHLE